MNEYLMTIIGSTISGIAAFYVGAKKNQREVESMGLDNVQKSLLVYNQIIEDLKEEIADLRKEISRLEKLVEELREENEKLHKEIVQSRKTK